MTTLTRYSKLNGNVVVQTILSEEQPGIATGDWISCPDNVGPGYTLDGSNWVPPGTPVSAAPVWSWYMDIGPFTDRFGTSKLSIDLSTDPIIMAFDKDLNRRKWVDLKDPRVEQVLNYIAGHTDPVLGTISKALLTDQQVLDILTTPVSSAENLALRKLYF